MALNIKLKQARLRKHWTLARASEEIGVHITTYNGWELGNHIPHVTTLDLLCQAFQASAEELGFAELSSNEQVSPEPTETETVSPLSEIVIQEDGQMLYDTLEVRVLSSIFAWRPQQGTYAALQHMVQQEIGRFDTMLQPQHNHDIQVSRRQALNVIAKLPIGLLGLTTLDDIKRLPHKKILSSCAASLSACRELYNNGEVQVVKDILSQYLPSLVKLAEYPSKYQRDAAYFAAQAYLIMTYLAEHQRSLDAMESYCHEAYKHGQIANNVDIQVMALARLAVKFDFESRWRKTLQTYQKALSISNGASPLYQSRMYAGLAAAHSYCFEQKEALHFISKAQETFSLADEKTSLLYAAGSNHHALMLWSGLVYKHVNQPDAAWKSFTQIGTLEKTPKIPEWNRIEFVNYAASVAIRQKDLEKSCVYLENAGKAALAIGHGQRYIETCDTYKELQVLWGNEPRVMALQDLFSQR